MATPARSGRRALSLETIRFSDHISRVFEEAVRKAREENRRLGIPNAQVDEQGRLTEELPDGTVRVLRSL
jgi:hypothetical protein